MRPLLASFLALATGQVSQPAVLPWGANSFRVQWAPPGLAIVNSSYSPFLDAPVSATPFVASGGAFTNGNLRLDVDPTTGLITATRVSDGYVFFKQTGLGWAPPVARGRFPSAQISFGGHAVGESLVGGGEQGLTGRVVLEQPFERNYIDAEYYGYNSGRQAFLPLFFSATGGWGLMHATPGYGYLRMDVAPYTSVLNASSAATVELWLTTTPGTPVLSATAPHPVLAMLTQYADAVGHAPRMPAFAAGFIASKDRYRNQTQFLEVAHGYVDRGIPLSLLTVDWFHWAHLGDMSLKPECWPDPQGMVDELRTLGIETMITHWPFMSKDSVHRAAYEAAGALAVNATSGTADTFWAYLQQGALITTLSEATRNLTMANWMAGYGKYGVKAMWLDETEPDRTGQSNDLIVRGEWTYEGASSTEFGPTWRQQWLRTMTDTLRAAHGEGEYFLLSRSAWLGTAKYGHAVWSGDTYSAWDVFGQQGPAGLGAGLSGIGLWTSDLGGYSPTMKPFDPSLEELYVRWAQFASVSPLMRLHGHRNGGPPEDPVCMQTNGDNEPWTLFSNQTNYDAFVAAIVWREQMRNYVMDAQAEWAASNAPMIAPVWLLFPGDPVCALQKDVSEGACFGAFMFGKDWLAKPITRLGQTSEWAYLPGLPAGQTWVGLHTGVNYGQGPVNVTVPTTPVSNWPLFYRNSA